MVKRFNYTCFGMVLVMVACLLFTSCGNKKDDEGMNQKQQEQEKAIRTLDEIESMNESIIRLLNGPAIPEEKQGQKQQDQGKESQQGQGAEQGKEQGQAEESPQAQGSEQEKGQGQEQSKESPQVQGSKQVKEQGEEYQQNQGAQQGKEVKEHQPQDEVWDDVEKNIIELHTLFNEYIPAASKLGASTELSTNANNTLNQLTKEAESKNHNEVLKEANNLHKSICDYYALHQDKRAPAKLLLFHTRRVMLSARVGDWQTAKAAMDELEDIWNTQKASFGEKQANEVAMLDLSISNLTGVVEEKNQNLVAIKGFIVLQNISELEKSLEEKK